MKISFTSMKLPGLEYPYDALEPFVDSRTLEIHYTKHHAGYLENFKAAIKDNKLRKQEPEEIFAKVSVLSPEVRNNGGGFFNHSFYWKILSPHGGGKPGGDLLDSIVKYFGTFEIFKNEFSAEAERVFGSGWTWLIKKPDGELRITSTANQDNPLMNLTKIKGKPIIAIDLWEHAYQLKYNNNKRDYIMSFWRFVNWEKASEFNADMVQICWKDLIF